MRSLIKLLALVGELLAWFVRIKRQEKQNAEVESIRRDPVDAFRNEFAGVPDNEAAGHALPSDQANTQINSK